MNTMETDEQPRVALNATDRCDRCGAQALHRATREDLEMVLLFCNHHVNDHREALEADGWMLTS